jgi:hypothetical protein
MDPRLQLAGITEGELDSCHRHAGMTKGRWIPADPLAEMREGGFTRAGGEFSGHYVPSQGSFIYQGPHDVEFAIHTIE